MDSKDQAIFFPKLRTNSLRLSNDYSPEFKSIYDNALELLEKKYKRHSERRLLSISINRTLDKTDKKLKRG